MSLFPLKQVEDAVILVSWLCLYKDPLPLGTAIGYHDLVSGPCLYHVPIPFETGRRCRDPVELALPVQGSSSPWTGIGCPDPGE